MLAWRNDLHTDISLDTWNHAIAQVHKISSQTELIYFQYRILHHIVTTNNLRSKWDPSVSALCHACNTRVETIVHLFCDCDVVKKIWKFVQKWLQKLLKDSDLNLDNELIIFNDAKGPEKKFVNTVLLHVKRYIYSAKCLDTIPVVSVIVPKLIQACKIEKLIASRTNTISKHDKNWAVFLAWLYPQ